MQQDCRALQEQFACTRKIVSSRLGDNGDDEDEEDEPKKEGDEKEEEEPVWTAHGADRGAVLEKDHDPL
jgi:hypothetical protein